MILKDFGYNRVEPNKWVKTIEWFGIYTDITLYDNDPDTFVVSCKLGTTVCPQVGRTLNEIEEHALLQVANMWKQHKLK
jgi:hypothetical protein